MRYALSILCAIGILLALLALGPAGSLQAAPPGPDVRRESAVAPPGPPPLTGPASPFMPLVPGNYTFGPNYRANTDTSGLGQQEPSIEVNPLNPLNVVVMAKDERAGPSTKQDWIYTSTDGGITWINQMFPLISPPTGYSSDPIVNFADDGIVYVTALPYGGSTEGIQVAKSTDGGITFATATPVIFDPGTDKEWTAIDNFPASPFHHRMYVSWTNFSAGPAIVLKYSSDRGATWLPASGFVGVSQPAFEFAQFSMPVVMPNGDVIVTWYYYGGELVYARSTDGGASFGANTSIGPVTAPLRPPGAIWRLNPIPSTAANPLNGNLISMWSDGSFGAADILFVRGTGNGTVWSAPQRLAIPFVAGTYQVEPWVTYDETGTAHAIWYDNGDQPYSNVFHILWTMSTNDGLTWGPIQRISTAASDLNIGIPSGYNNAAGDYIQVSASHGNVYAAWTDTRSGVEEDIYVVRGQRNPPTSVQLTEMRISARSGSPPDARLWALLALLALLPLAAWLGYRRTMR